MLKSDLSDVGSLHAALDHCWMQIEGHHDLRSLHALESLALKLEGLAGKCDPRRSLAKEALAEEAHQTMALWCCWKLAHSAALLDLLRTSLVL